MRSQAMALLLGLAAVGPAAAAEDDDRAAVRAVVQSAYVEGVHAKGDADLMLAGFHPDFRMLTLQDGVLTAVSRDDWAVRIRGSAHNRRARVAVKAEYPVIDVAGNAAVVRVEVHRGGKHAFTDYLSLYRFPEGWRIVGKIFQAHP